MAGREQASELPEPIIVEGLCMSCMKNGENRILCLSVPHFREIIVMSFECSHCGWKNNEVQPASCLAPKGRKIALQLTTAEDLNRQVIKSEYASFSIPVIDFEIPPSAQKGVATTIEGMLNKAADNLEILQNERRAADAVLAEKIQKVIDRLRCLSAAQELPFSVILDDPTGNSHLEPLSNVDSDGYVSGGRGEGNPIMIETTLNNDPNMRIEEYERTAEQQREIGHSYGEEQPLQANTTEVQQSAEQLTRGADLPAELRPESGHTATSTLEKIHVGSDPNTADNKHASDDDSAATEGPMSIETPCSHCGKNGQTHIVEMDIPGFRACLLMSFVCEECGARSTEVKAAGPYGERARRWVLKIEEAADLNRDVLKSDTASIEIPQLKFETAPGTLGGKFTTVEGLLVALAEGLAEKNPFVMGDSAMGSNANSELQCVSKKLREFSRGEGLPVTIILDDMADHSYIGRRDPTLKVDASMTEALSGLHPDPQLEHSTYIRSEEQDDDLGISGMRTENYEVVE